ncbi:uncharacterized protein [Prorops nasuta]
MMANHRIFLTNNHNRHDENKWTILEKWKEERKRFKAAERKKKRPPFITGVVHYNYNGDPIYNRTCPVKAFAQETRTEKKNIKKNDALRKASPMPETQQSIPKGATIMSGTYTINFEKSCKINETSSALKNINAYPLKVSNNGKLMNQFIKNCNLNCFTCEPVKVKKKLIFDEDSCDKFQNCHSNDQRECSRYPSINTENNALKLSNKAVTGTKREVYQEKENNFTEEQKLVYSGKKYRTIRVPRDTEINTPKFTTRVKDILSTPKRALTTITNVLSNETSNCNDRLNIISENDRKEMGTLKKDEQNCLLTALEVKQLNSNISRLESNTQKKIYNESAFFNIQASTYFDMSVYTK